MHLQSHVPLGEEFPWDHLVAVAVVEVVVVAVVVVVMAAVEVEADMEEV